MRLRCLTTLALLGACGIPSNGPTMQPGQDCQACHNQGKASPSWTVAGTVFTNVDDPVGAGVEGAQITVTGADGRSVTMRSNGSGNFYTRERPAFPLSVRVEKTGIVRVMSTPVPDGACNRCHTFPAISDVDMPSGRVALVGGGNGNGNPLMSPGQNCLACHDGRGATSFTAAGTVYPTVDAAVNQGVSGVTVRFKDASGAVVKELVSNDVGNFYTADPLPTGAYVEVQQGEVIRQMSRQLPDGACNRCHTFPALAAAEMPAGRVALVGGDLGSPLMNPGQDCLACHDGSTARQFTAAGTVYPTSGSAANQGLGDVTVRFRDMSGAIVKELVSNAAGNFYTADPLPIAVRIEIQGGSTIRRMGPSASSPVSCNRCHQPGGETSRVGLIGGG